MSEFSESYHLRTSYQQDAVDLLQKTGINGYVFPPEKGWTAFVADTASTFILDQRLALAATHPLLHYVYADDHGWQFGLIEHGDIVTAYRCSWDAEPEVDSSALRVELLEPFLHSSDGSASETLHEIFSSKNSPMTWEHEPGYRFGEALGLSNYKWIDFHHVDAAPPPGVVKVWPAGDKPTTSLPPPPPPPQQHATENSPAVTLVIARIISVFILLCAIGLASAAIIALGLWTPPRMPLSRAGMAAVALTSIPVFILGVGVWQVRRWATLVLGVLILITGFAVMAHAIREGRYLHIFRGLLILGIGEGQVMAMLVLARERNPSQRSAS